MTVWGTTEREREREREREERRKGSERHVTYRFRTEQYIYFTVKRLAKLLLGALK